MLPDPTEEPGTEDGESAERETVEEPAEPDKLAGDEGSVACETVAGPSNLADYSRDRGTIECEIPEWFSEAAEPSLAGLLAGFDFFPDEATSELLPSLDERFSEAAGFPPAGLLAGLDFLPDEAICGLLPSMEETEVEEFAETKTKEEPAQPDKLDECIAPIDWLDEEEKLGLQHQLSDDDEKEDEVDLETVQAVMKHEHPSAQETKAQPAESEGNEAEQEEPADDTWMQNFLLKASKSTGLAKDEWLAEVIKLAAHEQSTFHQFLLKTIHSHEPQITPFPRTRHPFHDKPRQPLCPSFAKALYLERLNLRCGEALQQSVATQREAAFVLKRHVMTAKYLSDGWEVMEDRDPEVQDRLAKLRADYSSFFRSADALGSGTNREAAWRVVLQTMQSQGDAGLPRIAKAAAQNLVDAPAMWSHPDYQDVVQDDRDVGQDNKDVGQDDMGQDDEDDSQDDKALSEDDEDVSQDDEYTINVKDYVIEKELYLGKPDVWRSHRARGVSPLPLWCLPAIGNTDRYVPSRRPERHLYQTSFGRKPASDKLEDPPETRTGGEHRYMARVVEAGVRKVPSLRTEYPALRHVRTPTDKELYFRAWYNGGTSLLWLMQCSKVLDGFVQRQNEIAALKDDGLIPIAGGEVVEICTLVGLHRVEGPWSPGD